MFQFTHPGKGATQPSQNRCSGNGCFNSRTLGRVRPQTALSKVVILSFQFTHPGKGATLPEGNFLLLCSVSIHAPWEGCDGWGGVTPPLSLSFNSRTLGRVRLHTSLRTLFGWSVSIHAPWEGCDKECPDLVNGCKAFQFTHPGKGATVVHSYRACSHQGFNSRTLGRVRRLPAYLLARAPCFNSRTLGRVRL